MEERLLVPQHAVAGPRQQARRRRPTLNGSAEIRPGIENPTRCSVQGDKRSSKPARTGVQQVATSGRIIATIPETGARGHNLPFEGSAKDTRRPDLRCALKELEKSLIIHLQRILARSGTEIHDRNDGTPSHWNLEDPVEIEPVQQRTIQDKRHRVRPKQSLLRIDSYARQTRSATR
jgi:hypothetical protein